MALDVGRKRTGVAVTDPLGIIASGLTTVQTASVFDYIASYLATEKIDRFVVGMPTQMNNQPSEAVRYVQPVVNRLKKVFPSIPIDLFDERFTSSMAHNSMIEMGMRKLQRRDKALVDTISATIILQSYMLSKEYLSRAND